MLLEQNSQVYLLLAELRAWKYMGGTVETYTSVIARNLFDPVTESL
jgi:hypothetical protein